MQFLEDAVQTVVVLSVAQPEKRKNQLGVICAFISMFITSISYV